jgi:tetratricopeptide (TPR) repeat protein
VIAKLHVPEGQEDMHTLSWRQYGYLMLGKFDEAKKDLDLAKASADRNPNSQRVQDGYLGMRARYILESEKWEKIPLESTALPAAAGAPAATAAAPMAGMPGMNAPAYGGNAAWTFIAGFSAAKLNDAATADRAAAQLRAMAERTAASNAYAAKPLTIMEKEVSAAAALVRGNRDDAVRLAKEAADVELTLSAPSGPPDPIKPAVEFYADTLLAAGKPAEAAAAFEQALLRTPNRTPAVQGLAKARQQAGSQQRSQLQ